MKKPVIIFISIVILLLLGFRKLYTHIEGVKMEKLFYVRNLNLKFSARIDSVGLLNRRNSGLIFFHGLTGNFRESEDKLHNQLAYNGDLRFILSNSNNDALSIITGAADKYEAGDSIVVDTSTNRITFYRGTKIIGENNVTDALNGRPF